MSIKNKIKNYFTMDDEYEYEYQQEEITPESKESTKQQTQKVVSLTSMQQSTSKVVLCEPRTYNEAQEIADNIVNRRAVVINLQRVDHQQAKRIVDFLSGTVYAVNGDIQKLGSETFLCTPDNVEVSGTISEAFAQQDEFEKGW
ncbi:cell division protein SepF [Oceanobacillus profundus]|uniref:Cell division protein SepF n=1 Tax=Oceanobacillus profundus TaxID=372463 RepID=A0A417YKK0_9BACI|nr:cell division protein SepF [Oceanobacillus profundus]MBR3119471.1 cell division protein SepF [Oceanobacillus sp.]PAE30098.1 cell division protein SepF [Paenibacillus sp. 7884-2]MCM3396261.1 cell division protein SepF [Oceanobacillus profundus]MDO6449729.1 cell division protein SepF [Oceanobacillus profundus]RHW33731.1 cell division protein SepF [Oceanobacillus profundus]